jgi:phenylalanine ammonia-lyase
MFQTHAHVTSMQTAAQPQAVQIDGHNVVAVARNGAQAKIAESVHPAVEASVAFKESKNHTSVYGVTTGFGGSADTRTSDTEALQISLLEHQLCGFLPVNASYENM